MGRGSLGLLTDKKKKPKAEQETAQPTAARFKKNRRQSKESFQKECFVGCWEILGDRIFRIYAAREHSGDYYIITTPFHLFVCSI